MEDQFRPEELAHSVEELLHSEGLPTPTEAGQKAASEALEFIKGLSFSERHRELGRMLNCQFCSLRHRENDNGREKPCEQHFSADVRERGIIVIVPEQIAGQTKSTKPNFMIESEIPRKQSRIFYGANTVKGRRKNPRKRPQSPMTYYERILKAKEEKEKQ